MRVDEVEALAHQRLLVVEHHAVQVDERLGIDEDANVAELKDAIALGWAGFKANHVTQSRTAATLYAQPQPALSRRNLLLRHGRADVGQRLLRYLDSLR